MLTDHENPVPAIHVVEGPNLNSSGCFTLNNEFNLNETSRVEGSPCDYRSNVLYQLLYLGVLQAFTMLLVGDLSLFDLLHAPTESSSIGFTKLLNNKELNFLIDSSLFSPTATEAHMDLQHALWQTNKSEISKMTKLRVATASSFLSLADAIEQMFQNFTVSLMSSADLQ